MELNRKQKEYLIEEFFDAYSLVKIFEALTKEWVVEQKIEIKPEYNGSGWWELYMEGKLYTSLNFNMKPYVLEKIKLLK